MLFRWGATALVSTVWLALLGEACGEASGRRIDDSKLIRSEQTARSTEAGHTTIRAAPRRAKLLEHESLLDMEDDTGFRMRDYGVQIYERPAVWGHPVLGSLMVYHVKEQKQEPCGMLIAKVIYAIKYAMAKKHRNHKFVSAPEAELYTELEDNEDGREVLTNTMRVLGNYSLAEGIKSGSVWKIDDQNHYISCEQNIQARLEEHVQNFAGDAIFQGDMASVGRHCTFGEQSSKRGTHGFEVGTLNCKGQLECQFSHSDEAVHFCSLQPECIAIEGRIDPGGCEGGFGCYVPKKGELTSDASWESTMGGKTFIKHCPGALLEIENAVKQGRRMAGDRWSSGDIPYCFTEDVSDVGQEAVHIAVQAIMRQVPCLQFTLVNRKNHTACNVIPSILFTSVADGGCWSYVGQVSGKAEGWEHKSQFINIDRGCELPGIMLHEIGHALGMVHQQARGDRDDHFMMHWGNVTSGREINFQKSTDAQTWAFSGYDDCEDRAGIAKLIMTVDDCANVQGVHSCRSPTDCECRIDICESGRYMFAPPSTCGQKVAAGTLMMQARDCGIARGVVQGSGHADADWVQCNFDICEDTGFKWSKPFACNNKIGGVYFNVRNSDCAEMEGGMHLHWSDVGSYTQCHFDLCSGEVDTPFDWTSLMMYSPYQYSKDSTLNTGKQTTEPIGHRRLMDVIGQRMSFSGLDVFHLGHEYGCWDTIKPDMNLADARAIIQSMNSGEFFEYNSRRVCEDVTPEHTGFDVHTENGFLKHASCADLEHYCHNETIGQYVRSSCPVSCFICMPTGSSAYSGVGINGPCFDASQTGIRFRDGPKAACQDLINYCNHSTIGTQVTTACPMSCGLCEIHVEGPYLDQYGNCADLATHEEPQFTVSGSLAGCEDIKLFCQNHPDSYLIRHKCPLTCGVCGEYSPPPPPHLSGEVQLPGDFGDCTRRRRHFGFCSTRRRRLQ